MSLYAAENSDRTGREEVLLSRLFGTLFMVNREGYLGALFDRAGINVAPGDYRAFQIQFWPELGAYSPDLIVEGDSLLLFVVSRPRKSLDPEKLRLLAESGWKLSPRFRLLVITDGSTPPPAMAALEDRLPKNRRPALGWMSWNDVFMTLYGTLRKRDENATTKELIEAFLGLLTSEGLAPFVGFDGEDLKSYRESLPALDRVYSTAKRLIADIESILTTEGIRRISLHGPVEGTLPIRAPRSLLVQYTDEAWDPGVLACGSLILRTDYVVGEVHVGFRSIAADSRARALLVEGRNHISKLFEKRENLRLRLIGSRGGSEPTRETSLIAQLETQEGKGITSVEFISVHDGERDDLLPALAEELISLRDFVTDVPLLPLHRTPGESPFVVAGT